jgi:hypothetical protein
VAFMAAEDGLVANHGSRDAAVLPGSGPGDDGDLAKWPSRGLLAPRTGAIECSLVLGHREAIDAALESFLAKREGDAEQLRVGRELRDGGRRRHGSACLDRPWRLRSVREDPAIPRLRPHQFVINAGHQELKKTLPDFLLAGRGGETGSGESVEEGAP